MDDSIIGLTAAGRSYEQPATAAAMAMHRESLATVALPVVIGAGRGGAGGGCVKVSCMPYDSAGGGLV